MTIGSTHYEKALALFKNKAHGISFDEALAWHFLNGFVFAQPDVFAMGRPVVSTAPRDLIADPSHVFPADKCDCWFIFVFSGSLVRLCELAPWPLPKVCFARRNEKGLLFFSLDRIRVLSLGVNNLLAYANEL